MIEVEIGGRAFMVSDHAIERYQERVRPSYSLEAAALEMLHRLRAADIFLCLPQWARAKGLEWKGDAAHEFVGVDEELLLPVERGVILTVIARSWVGAQVRVIRG